MIRGRRTIGGSGMVELLMALPIVLLLGLGALQAGLLLSAKLALNHAAQEAGRAGTLSHASRAAIEEGLARGLVPWLYGSTDYGSFAANRARAQLFVSQGVIEQWVRITQLSPTQASFDDWSIGAIDENGEPLPDTQEIPNDNLFLYKTSRQPRSGSSASRGSEPIGSASGQTLLDANTLKLGFVVGVPASVPVIGPLTLWALRGFYGCEAPAARRLGLIQLGTNAPLGTTLTDQCVILSPVNGGVGRFPLKTEVTLGMQTGARQSGLVAAKQQEANRSASLGAGSIETAPVLQPPEAFNSGGQGVGVGVTNRPAGYSQIGSERQLLVPGTCPA